MNITSHGWSVALKLALINGWKPMGTVCAIPVKWDMPDEEVERLHAEAEQERGGPYNTNDFCRILAEDARNIADALERALEDIPRESAWEGPAGGIVSLPDGSIRNLPEPNLLQYFSGREGRKILQRLIAFCRVGDVVIA
jgi:hypothetical protein